MQIVPSVQNLIILQLRLSQHSARVSFPKSGFGYKSTNSAHGKLSSMLLTLLVWGLHMNHYSVELPKHAISKQSFKNKYVGDGDAL